MDFFRKLFDFPNYDDFNQRTDSRKLWKQYNPNQEETIDIFLSILDDAFMIPKRYRFRIQPEDTIGDLYKRSAVLIDNFEIETMVNEIAEQFGYELHEEELSFDLSVGTILSKILKHKR